MARTSPSKVSYGLKRSHVNVEYAAMPDVVLFPAVASPLVPAYYLPELIGQPPLVLSFKILADIYLAHIRYRILSGPPP